MSDITPKAATPAKAVKTETATPKSETSSSAGSADTASSTTTTTSAPTEKITSGKGAMGGAGAVHYGFFSNVKTPQYRSGWDSIWSKDDKSDKKSAQKSNKSVEAKKSPARRSIRPKDPLEVNLTLDDLPDPVREALIEAARAKLKGSRVSYNGREKAGAVSWTIACTIRR